MRGKKFTMVSSLSGDVLSLAHDFLCGSLVAGVLMALGGYLSLVFGVGVAKSPPDLMPIISTLALLGVLAFAGGAVAGHFYLPGRWWPLLIANAVMCAVLFGGWNVAQGLANYRPGK